MNALCSELHRRKDYLRGSEVKTIYFGGGTPSLLTPEQFRTIVEAIRETFGTDELVEFTVECNPDDISPSFLGSIRALGVNRISLGVQTFCDETLRFLGRRHTSWQAIKAVDLCHEEGFDNISIDLMYGLPGQTIEEQSDDLEKAISLGVSHISSYCLSYEPSSALESMKNEGLVFPANDELCAKMYSQMCSMLVSAGMEHYEISNFTFPGFRSLHNYNYWERIPYIGIGAGAHSFDSESRQWNISHLDAYMEGEENGVPATEKEILSERDIYNEKIMLSLRTSDGIDLNTLSKRDRSRLETDSFKFIRTGQMQRIGSFIRISPDFLFVSDSIISSLFVS